MPVKKLLALLLALSLIISSVPAVFAEELYPEESFLEEIPEEVLEELLSSDYDAVTEDEDEDWFFEEEALPEEEESDEEVWDLTSSMTADEFTGMETEEAFPQYFTETYIEVNPLYAELGLTAEELMLSFDSLESSAEPITCASMEEAGAIVREQMKKRQETVTLRVQIATELYNFNDNTRDIFAQAVRHTGVPNEGDYLKWQYGGWQAKGSICRYPTYYDAVITYTIPYYTTAAQESTMDTKVPSVISSLSLSGKSQQAKAKAIYDYICKNTKYDYTNLNKDSYKLKYTAYAALINKTAVCQGYAVLFYRMALTAGLDCRVITGTGNGGPHAWNIVKIGNKYYNLDSTWDAGKTSYSYYLKSNANFPKHTRDSEYNTSSFNSTYPMATANWKACSTHKAVTDPAVAATCTKTGLTQGSHCSVCGNIITAQKTVAMKAHTSVAIPAVAATCTSTGSKGGTKCSVCGKTLTAPTTIAKAPHKEVSIAPVAPTCTAAGSKDGTKCGVCNVTIKAPTSVPATGHTSVTVPAKAPTCTTTGLTAGTKCKTCGTILKAQSTVAVKAHSFYGGKCTACGTADKNLTGMYRLYNPYTLEHMFSSSATERTNLLRAGWTLDGFAFSAPSSGQPVYRLYNPYGDWHTYSTNQNEINSLKASGWQVDGVMGYSATSDFSPVFKMYNPYESVNYWHFCSDVNERNWLMNLGWQYQGIAWYAIR